MTTANTNRALAAMRAVAAFCEKDNPDENDRIRTAMIDLIANVGHAADGLELDFEQIITTALDHWRAERPPS